MLIESRRIDFPEADLLEAIAIHDERSSQRLGGAAPLGYEIETDEETAHIHVKVAAPEANAIHLVALPFSYVVAAMIRYCIDEGIPIPKRARKSLEISGDYIALVLKVTNATIADQPGGAEAA